MQQNAQKRIVILGGGFAGLTAAIHLGTELGRHPEIDILLIDRTNSELFTPMLHEVATGLISPSHLLRPIRPLALRYGFRFQESNVRTIDLDLHTVETDDGPVTYDYLLVALGSTTNFFNIPGAGEKTVLTFKTAEDAVVLRNAIIGALEAADVEMDPAQRRKHLTFLVAGAGATGVEIAAAIHDYIVHTLLPTYPTLGRREVRIVLMEATARILAGLDRGLATFAKDKLEQRSCIDVRLNSPISRVRDGIVFTSKDEAIPAGTIVWTTGVRAGNIVATLPVEIDRTGRVVVSQMLNAPGYPNVFFSGDCCRFQYPEDEEPLPPNAQVAIQQAHIAACNIAARLMRREGCVFTFKPMVEIISLGHRAGVADFFGFKIAGPTAWMLWKVGYLARLTTYQNKAGVLSDWLISSLFERNISRVRG